MDTRQLQDWLGGSPLLASAPAHLLSTCAAAARLRSLSADDYLIRAGQQGHGVLLIVSGDAQVRTPGAASQAVPIAEVGAGAVLGEIQAVSGLAATADVVATTPCEVVELDAALLRQLGDQHPPFNEHLVQLAARRLRGLVFRRAVDALLGGIDPAQVDALLGRAQEVVLDRGELLMREGEPGDAWYILTSGRLGVASPHGDRRRRIADLLPGASVGEMALITGAPRSATVRAERRSSLMRLSREDFELFSDAHPAFARRLTALVVQRLSAPRNAKGGEGGRVLVALRASGDPQLAGALRQLASALGDVAGTRLCLRSDFEDAIGRPIGPEVGESHPVWNRFDVWLEEAQRQHGLVLLDGGSEDDLWRRECLLHADRCLWLAEPVDADTRAPDAAERGRLDAAQQWAARDARRLPWWLLVVHPTDTLQPRNTRAWLDAGEFERHLHLRLDDPACAARVARLLAGKGIGLALSGGGARGFAHIGVMRYLFERGIPVDQVGGTSFGAIEAAMYACSYDIDTIVALNRDAIAMQPFKEYTLPLIAMMRSRRRDAVSRHSFGERRIEDLWIPFLCVSADLRAARPVVHERGALAQAVSASAALPGVLVPVVDAGRILVDGGIFNNLPSDLVKARCGGPVIGVRVTPEDDLSVPEGGFPSPWRVLWHGLVPWLDAIRSPRLGDLLIRTMTVSGADHMQQSLACTDVLIEPDVAGFGMLQFKAIDALVERGHEAAARALADWSPD